MESGVDVTLILVGVLVVLVVLMLPLPGAVALSVGSRMPGSSSEGRIAGSPDPPPPGVVVASSPGEAGDEAFGNKT